MKILGPDSCYGDSPLGREVVRPRRRRQLDKIKELMACLGEFLGTDPTVDELEMLDTIINVMTWSHEGYKEVEKLARVCFKILHGEEAEWKPKSRSIGRPRSSTDASG